MRGKAERERIKAAAKQIEERAAALTAAVDAYNEALATLRELVRGIEADWQAAWDKRSERWQEGAAGRAAAETITAWAAFGDDLDDIQINLSEVKIPTID